MAGMYAFLAGIAQSLGVLFFMACFGAAIAYAFWPRNRATFDRAARLALDEDDRS
jgi:cytochrome c oxidase cbb3-type subunit 4